ncbi:MAG: serine hydrolase domain-containing protein [Bacilli bacterium]
MSYQTEISKVIKRYKYVGMNSLLIKNNQYYTSSNGFMDLETKQPVELDTIFRIASISKVIVALGIMKLYEAHQLDVKDDISKYLGYMVRNPHYPNVPITIEMLMTQTSSISDGADDTKGYDGVNGPKIYIKLQDLLTNPSCKYYLERTFSNHLPGTHWEYSNFGCGILACIIEKVSGMYFSDYIRKEILLPLDIDGSYRISDIINKNKVATLYGVNSQKEFVMERNLDLFLQYEYPKYELGDNFRMPAGGLFISITDLCKIMELLMHKGIYKNIRLFKEETITYMMDVHWSGDSDDPTYRKKGLQLLILDSYGQTLYGHFGSAYGLKSFMLFNDHIGIISLCNGAIYGSEEKRGITDFQHDLITFMLNYEEHQND